MGTPLVSRISLEGISEKMCVVYFDQLLGAAHPKAGQNLFFSCFSTFFVNFKAFSVISLLKYI